MTVDINLLATAILVAKLGAFAACCWGAAFVLKGIIEDYGR